jgi:hypothetical protein
MNALAVSSSASKLLWSAGLFLLTLSSGFWLSQSGKPYSSLIFNLHKMIAVVTVGYVLINSIKTFRFGDISTGLLMALILSAFLLLVLVATGGMLILEVELDGLPLKVHQITPLLAVASSLAALYLMLPIKP